MKGFLTTIYLFMTISHYLLTPHADGFRNPQNISGSLEQSDNSVPPKQLR